MCYNCVIILRHQPCVCTLINAAVSDSKTKMEWTHHSQTYNKQRLDGGHQQGRIQDLKLGVAQMDWKFENPGGGGVL